MTDLTDQAGCPSCLEGSADYQFLEDLATAYWSSEVVFAAIHLNIFSHLTAGATITALAKSADCKEQELLRLLQALAVVGLVSFAGGKWQNSAAAGHYLIPGRERSYLGDFLLYRRYLQEPWQKLADRVAGRSIFPEISLEDDYKKRTFFYVRALDQLARLKAEEIAPLLNDYQWQPPILDIGGGAGSISRRLIHEKQGTATVIDLPEVIEAAQSLYPDEQWQQMRTIAADFRTFDFDAPETFGLVILGNFLHTYDQASAQELLAKSAKLLAPGGLILVHDYFPDRTAVAPRKGTLYDLNMMLNTYHGSCHPTRLIIQWLEKCGLKTTVTDLASDSSIIVARS